MISSLADIWSLRDEVSQFSVSELKVFNGGKLNLNLNSRSPYEAQERYRKPISV